MVVAVEVGLVDAGQPPRVVHSRGEEDELREPESHRSFESETEGKDESEDSETSKNGLRRPRDRPKVGVVGMMTGTRLFRADDAVNVGPGEGPSWSGTRQG